MSSFKRFYVVDLCDVSALDSADLRPPEGMERCHVGHADVATTFQALLRASFDSTIDSALYGDEYAASVAGVIAFDPESFIVVGDSSSGRPVGMVLAWCDKLAASKGVSDSKLGRIHWLAVDPAYQGRGLGRFLVQAALQHHKARGRAHVYLSTEEDRDAAIHLYESIGFKQVEHRPSDEC